jgi:hypothetical protein
MQKFTFVINHIYGTANKVVDVLSRKCLILQEFRVNTLGFDRLRICIEMIQVLNMLMKYERILF